METRVLIFVLTLLFASGALAFADVGTIGGGFTDPGTAGSGFLGVGTLGGDFTGPGTTGGFSDVGTFQPDAPTDFTTTPSTTPDFTTTQFSGNGFQTDFPGSGFDYQPNFPNDQPAEWQSLENKQIPRGSPDNTVVYAELTDKCEDPDGPEFVTVVSRNLNYDLFIDEKDLKISRLFAGYEGIDAVTLSCNGVEASFNLQIGTPQGGARWHPLSNQFVHKGSPDATIVYPNIVSNCVDQTKASLEFRILSRSNNYQLFIIDRDLRIYNLNPSFEGTETVTLSCNDVSALFQLTVGDDLRQPFESKDNESGDLEVHIGAIVVPEQTEAGMLIPIVVSFRNTGDEKLENTKVRAVIPELGAYSASAGPFDLNEGKRTTQILLIELPEDVESGTYTVRLTIDGASLHRVVHRDLIVE